MKIFNRTNRTTFTDNAIPIERNHYTCTCKCQCDMWCKTHQYLDYKNCICKNKLIGRVIEECTSIINETMINNKNNIDNDNTITYIFIGLFSVLLFIGIVCFCVFAYFKWIKGKKLFKNKYTDY